MHIALENPDQPDVLQLIDELDAYQKPLYPPASHHGIDLAALRQPQVLFAVARDDDAVAMGCGALVQNAGYGEIKRMFVRPECRGLGVATGLLELLEAEAVARGCTLFMLETGVSQPAALSFYERAGYVRRGPFGNYLPDPLSVFMSKQRDSR